MHQDSSTRTIPLSQGEVAVVDASDFEMLSHWTWNLTDDGYASAYNGMSRSYVRMHRLLMIPGPGLDVHHINHNPLDNRRSNLRACAHQDNQRSQAIRRTSASGFKGVGWHSRDRAWRAYITVDYKQVSLGYFRDKEAAARAYDTKARELFGEFACLNFPEEANA